jgi:hypothetical protein
MRESYPGYNVTPRSLHAVYGHQAKSATYNPYHRNHDSNYIGNRSDDDVDFDPWENCSDILDSCKYYEPRQIHASKSYELKVQSLNIRSLHSAMSSLKDSIEQYTKFDILCFNETNCIAENLAFKGKELELEGFHPPFIQAPARESGRGGGLEVYVNKNLCDLSDIQIKVELSFRDNAKSGEFQVIEITYKNHKNTILCNMYRSPSGNLASFLLVGMHTEGLARHNNKNIFFLGDSNINLLEYEKNDQVTRYVDLFPEYEFASTISRPTRITSHSTTLIDHIFVNYNCHAVTKSSIITESLVYQTISPPSQIYY